MYIYGNGLVKQVHFYGHCLGDGLVRYVQLFYDGLMKQVYFGGHGLINQLHIFADGLVKQVYFMALVL